MKILVTKMQTEKGIEIVSFQSLPTETENIKHQLFDVEDIPDKEGYKKEVVWDKEKNSPKFEYVKIPPTEMDLLKERLKITEKAVSEALKDKKDKLVKDELSELDEL